MFLALVEAAGRRQGALQVADRLLEGGAQRGEQVQGLGVQHLGGFGQAAVGTMPAAGEGQPVLHEHGEELGPDFAEHAPGLLTAGCIDLAVPRP